MINDVCSVLLVDDEALPRRLLGERISKIPGITLAASLSDGSAAQDFLKENVVDIVITDIRMPVVDGLELTAFIQKLDPLCSTIIISSYGEFEYARKALQYGACDYLLKPLQFTQVIEVIERCRDTIFQRRKQVVFSQTAKYHALELRIAKEPIKKWELELNGLLTEDGTLIRITSASVENHSNIRLYGAYKNLLAEVLPNAAVLSIGVDGDNYDYLIIPSVRQPQYSLLAVMEHLCRIVDHPIVWTQCGTIHSAQELDNLLTSRNNEPPSDAIARACLYMKQHLKEPLTRGDVASQVFLSSSYFGQLFKKTMGVGYNEYLTNLRIEQAKKLLDSNISIREIALAVGFQDTRYFSEVFYKKTGYIPSEYRRVYLAGQRDWKGNI